MSKIYVAGPAYVWIGTGVAFFDEAYDRSNYAFFGFTEKGLTITTQPKTEDVLVDYSGEMPADVSLLGIDCKINGTFTRYNEFLLRNLMSSLNRIDAGYGPPGSIGTLLMSEQAITRLNPVQTTGFMSAPPLLIYSSYGFKPEFGDMIKTMRVYSAFLSDALPQTLSVRRKAPEVSWRAIPAFGAINSSGNFVPNLAPYNAYRLFGVDDIDPDFLPDVN
jgi:hypothetical protein